MSFQASEWTGALNLLGQKGLREVTCKYNRIIDDGGNTHILYDKTFRMPITNTDQLVIGGIADHFSTTGPAEQDYLEYLAANWSGSIPGLCPGSWESPELPGWGFEFTFAAVNDASTGIFGLDGVIVAGAAVGMFLAVLMVAWMLSKRTVEEVGGGDDDDDDLEYYEGWDGKTYWRLPAHKRYGWNQ